MTDFSISLQSLRKSKGITQNELAEKLGISPQAVSKWENGSYPDADFIPKIADFFEVSIDELYGRGKEKLPLEEEIYQNIYKGFGWEKEKQKEFFDKYLEYFWAALNGCFNWKAEYQKRQVRENASSGSILITTEGISFMSNRKVCECGFVLKKPQDGFKALFNEKDRLEMIFGFLGDQDNLKILEFMFSLKEMEVVKASRIAKKTGVDKSKVEKSMDRLVGFVEWAGAFESVNIMEDDGKTEKAYKISLGNGAQYLLLLSVAQFISHPTTAFEPLTVQFDTKNEALVESD